MSKVLKVVTVVGARPQFIKAATLSRVFADYDDVQEIIVHTGQHYDAQMSDVFFEELNIPKPDFHLAVGSLSHGAQTGKMLAAIEEVLLSEEPDVLVVYGDTNSTLAAALAAAKLHIPVAHIEAGLRSFNRKMPEEVNRVLTDHVSDFLFVPTQIALRHLRKEGITGEAVQLVGDVMYDAALFYSDLAEGNSKILKNIALERKAYVLATIHRAENTDALERLDIIFKALTELARHTAVIMPIHPRTKKQLELTNFDFQSSQIRFIEPVGYLDMVMLERSAKFIITDSGGVQKEAFFHQVPCLTLRDETEWTELVEHGWNHLLKVESLEVLSKHFLEVLHLTSIPDTYPNLYGKGNAAHLTCDFLRHTFL